jgi:hypothetical protein
LGRRTRQGPRERRQHRDHLLGGTRCPQRVAKQCGFAASFTIVFGEADPPSRDSPQNFFARNRDLKRLGFRSTQ